MPRNELIAGILGVRRVKSCSCPLGMSSLTGETKQELPIKINKFLKKKAEKKKKPV